MLEITSLNGLAIVVLKDTTFSGPWGADNDVAEADIIPPAWCPSAHTNHQSNFNILEGAQHVCRYTSCRASPIFAVWKHCDDDVVASHLAESIDVAVIWRLVGQAAVFLVEMSYPTWRGLAGGLYNVLGWNIGANSTLNNHVVLITILPSANLPSSCLLVLLCNQLHPK